MDEREQRSDGSAYGTLWAFVAELARMFPYRLALALAMMVALGLTEGVGLLLLLPLMQSIGLDVGGGSVGAVAGLVAGALGAAGLRPTLATVLVLFVAASSAQALLGRQQRVYTDALVHDFTLRLRERLYGAITRANWLFISRSRSSDFVHALITEVDRVGYLTYNFLTFVAGVLGAAVYVALALRLSTVMTVVAFGCGAALLFVAKRRLRASRRTGEALSRATGDLYGAAIEHLGGLKTTKSYGAEGRNAELFSGLSARLAGTQLQVTREHAGLRLWSAIGSVAVLSLMLYVSFELLALPTSGVLLLVFLFARITPRLVGLQETYQYLVNALPAFAAVERLRAECERAAEPETGGGAAPELRREIRFDGVSFAYEAGGPRALRGVDLVIPAGKTTAVVGPSGAGKSTVADLVMGLIVPDEGRLLVDGAPLSPDGLRGWRERIGYVAQDTFLFHDTVRANLLWACPAASDEEVGRALDLAVAGEFVAAMPAGVETVVGDRGVRLSGGERQRLALARALLRRPSLIILDEATSALDTENEKRLQRAIEGLHGAVTILVIAHRFTTIRNADLIYVLERGEVVESGDWESLVAREDGRFRAMSEA